MRSGQGPADALDQICLDEKNGESEVNPDHPSVSDVGPDSDGATASSYIFSPQIPPSFPPADEFLGFCAERKDKGTDPLNYSSVEGISTIEEDRVRPRCSSPLVFDSNHARDTMAAARKGFLMFKKAGEILAHDKETHRPTDTITASNSNIILPSANDSSTSEPATVEVTSINKTTPPEADNLAGSPPEEFPPPAVVASPASSTSALDVVALKKTDPKLEQFRMFHYPRSKNSVAYHSMPTISDIP